MVGGVDPGRVVDEVGVDPPAAQRELDPAALGEAEVAALGHDAAPQVLAVHAEVVVDPVAGVRVGLGRRLDVRADAAVVEQVDGGAQDRRDQLARRQLLRVDPEREPRLGRDRRSTWPNAATRRRPRRSSSGRSRPSSSRAARTAACARRTPRPGSAPGRRTRAGGRTPRPGRSGPSTAARCRTRRPTCRRCRPR